MCTRHSTKGLIGDRREGQLHAKLHWTIGKEHRLARAASILLMVMFAGTFGFHPANSQDHVACTELKGLFLGTGTCKKSRPGLAGLFTGAGEVTAPFLRLPATRSGNSEPVVGRESDRRELVLFSTNKSLSQFGPDSPAKLVVRCSNGDLAILLNFPGYPVSGRQGQRDISYTLDDGAAWHAKMETSSDFSTLGLWQHEQAANFLRTIAGSGELHVETRDSDNTQINATFSLDGFEKRMNESCRV